MECVNAYQQAIQRSSKLQSNYKAIQYRPHIFCSWPAIAGEYSPIIFNILGGSSDPLTLRYDNIVLHVHVLHKIVLAQLRVAQVGEGLCRPAIATLSFVNIVTAEFLV